MKYFFTVISVLLIFNMGSSQGIEFFQGTWKEALEKSKSEDKILFVDSYAKWCGPCKRMAKKVFTQEVVGDFYNKNFINLKLDMETPDGRTFDKIYPVSAYPTMFFLASDGKVLKKVKGARQADGLIELGEEAIKGYDKSGAYMEAYENGDRSFENVLPYIKELAKVGKPNLKIANDFLRNNTDLTEEQETQILFYASTEADSKIFDRLMDNKKTAISIFGKEEFNQKILTACDNTIDKSIEYEVPSLKEEALKKSKTVKGKEGDKFRYQANMKYASAMADDELYLKNAEKLFKKIGKEDASLSKWIINDIIANHKTNDECKSLAEKCAKHLYEENETNDNLILYAKVLDFNNNTNKAIELLENRVSTLDEKAKERRTLNGLINYFKSKQG